MCVRPLGSMRLNTVGILFSLNKRQVYVKLQSSRKYGHGATHDGPLVLPLPPSQSCSIPYRKCSALDTLGLSVLLKKPQTPAISQTRRGTARTADTGLQEPTVTHSFSVPSPQGSEDASRWQEARGQTKPLCVEEASSLLSPLSCPRNVQTSCQWRSQ